MKSATVEANNINLHYYRAGREGALPVVLLHGITDDGRCWPRLVEALQGDYDLILVDARGHGHSDAPETGYQPDTHAADVAGLIAALGLERPVVLGHSMGAEIAARVAAQYPDRVRAVILEDPPWLAEDFTAEQRQAEIVNWHQTITQQRATSCAALIAQGKTNTPTWDDREYAPWAEAKRRTHPAAGEFIGAMGGWRAIVPRIQCPLLLLTADTAPDGDAIVTEAVVREAMALAPRGQHVYICCAGHNIRREQFAPYVDVVRGFLAAMG